MRTFLETKPGATKLRTPCNTLVRNSGIAATTENLTPVAQGAFATSGNGNSLFTAGSSQITRLNRNASSGFDAGKQLSIAVSFVGVLLMLGHVGGQVGEGSASGWSLVIGRGCFVVGVILALLFTILIRLDRVEQQIAGSDTGDSVDRDEDQRG